MLTAPDPPNDATIVQNPNALSSQGTNMLLVPTHPTLLPPLCPLPPLLNCWNFLTTLPSMATPSTLTLANQPSTSNSANAVRVPFGLNCARMNLVVYAKDMAPKCYPVPKPCSSSLSPPFLNIRNQLIYASLPPTVPKKKTQSVFVSLSVVIESSMLAT